MTHMTWTDSFSVGVAQFDEEHKDLIRLINELQDSVNAGTADATLRRIYQKMVAHTVAHFEHEEGYFDTVHYPRARQHKSMHAHLTRSLLAFQNDIGRKDSTQVATEILRFLGESLKHHIQGEDKRYGAFLNENGIS